MNKLTQLPRDSRDTLFLLAVIAVVLLPQTPYLAPWCSALAASVLLWRGVLAWQCKPLPAKPWLLGVMGLALAATWFTHRSLLGREAGVTLIVLLLALKTLELRAKRDAYVVFFLGFFTMLTSFFNSQSLPMAAGILLGLMGLLTALVNAHMPVGKPPLWRAARTAATMALLGAPVMLALFVFFPRMAPLWGMPSDALSGRSGLSANMQVGNIGQLALDESIALRVRFDGPVPPQHELYFRGPVLSVFDGRTWQSTQTVYPQRTPPSANLQVQGTPVRYEVTLQPSLRPWLLLLDAAAQPPQLAQAEPRMTPQLQWLSSQPITDLVRYQAQSYPQFRHGPLRAQPTLRTELELPAGLNPRTQALAQQMRSDPQLANADARTLAGAVFERLRQGGYTYTLEPGTTGAHSADEFWFDSKQGFCEHIASAFVILMRNLGVPARIVTGYQGGNLNPVDGYWVVRQSDAHAWAEIWQEGSGWLRMDPTAAVAPGRVGTFARLQAPSGVVASALTSVLGTVSPDVLGRVRASWEALNNRWNQWVLDYTQSRQLNLLKNLGFESPSWEDLVFILAGLLVTASLAGAAWTLWERRQADPWLRLLQRVQRRLARADIQVSNSTPPRALAARLAQRPDASATAALRAWLIRLETQRYAPWDLAEGRAALAQLRREWRQLTWPAQH